MPITLDNLHESLKKDAREYEIVGLVSGSKIIGMMPFAGEIKDVRVYGDSTSGSPMIRLDAGSTALCASTSVVADTATDCPIVAGAAAAKNDLLMIVQTAAASAMDDIIVKLVFQKTEDLEDIS